MRKQSFGNYQVSVIGLGSSEFGGKCPENQAWEFMDRFVALGGNFIDTARVYGDFVTPKDGESEKVIGRWLSARHLRDQIFLSTKGGHPRLWSMRQSRLSREEVRGDMADSLNDLQTDHVEIYWLHRDDEHRPVGEIMETLQSLIDDGWTRMVGVSNWQPGRIREANAYAEHHGLTKIIANQPQFSLAAQKKSLDPTLVTMNEEIWHLHKEAGLVCCCFSSQAHGFFTKLEQDGVEALSENVKTEFLTEENLACYQRMKALQQETGISIGAIALAYLTSQPFPTFALVGASKMTHIDALQEAGDALLTDQQRDQLRSFVK
ncbi:MAG: aldo/keto reductase [Clostridia bacterium]|nr:aldo/keto reductase [Clostridia bacterium]